MKNLWQNGKENGDILEVKFYDTVDDELPENWTYPLIQPKVV